MSSKGKVAMVLMESLSGSGWKYIRIRPRVDGPSETIHFDPIVQQNVLFKELKRIRTLKDRKKKKR